MNTWSFKELIYWKKGMRKDILAKGTDYADWGSEIVKCIWEIHGKMLNICLRYRNRERSS
jgi:hypothetical protein